MAFFALKHTQGMHAKVPPGSDYARVKMQSCLMSSTRRAPTVTDLCKALLCRLFLFFTSLHLVLRQNASAQYPEEHFLVSSDGHTDLLSKATGYRHGMI